MYIIPFFIRLPTTKAKKLWELIESRQPPVAERQPASEPKTDQSVA
jgi:hypothetical protein